MIDRFKDDVTQSWSDPPDGVNAGIEPVENALAFVVALGVTFLTRNALQATWRRTMNREPPKNPASHQVDWRDALLWGAVSGAVVGMARVASRRASSSVYRSIKS